MPAFQGATETGFVESVMSKLLNFALVQTPGGSCDSARTLTGKDAVQWQYQKVQALKEKPCHGDIHMLVIFGWCLSKAENEKVSQWRSQAADGQAPAAGAAAASSSSAEVQVKAGTSRAKDKAQHLDDMAKQLLKR